MDRNPTRRPQSFIATAVSLALVFTSALPAFAAPKASIAETRKQAAAASARLDDLAADLEERNEEYLQITSDLEETRGRIMATQHELEAAEASLGTANDQLSNRAISIYRDGPVDVINVLLGVTDFADLVTRLDIMRRIGRSDAVMVVSVRDARNRIDSAQRALENRRLEQTSLRERAAAKKDEVSSALNAQKSYLDQINGELKRLIAAERKRREREAAKRAAEIARQAASSAGSSLRSFNESALGEPHAEAVAVARRYVGKTPYVWGGTTPSGFDCSGLVQYCYRRIGISIPRTSRQQYLIGAFIPASRLDLLEPGDLVFFGRNGDPGRVHHVGMFIGEGNMIHAPQSGELVSVASLLERIQSRGDYVGACRP